MVIYGFMCNEVNDVGSIFDYNKSKFKELIKNTEIDPKK